MEKKNGKTVEKEKLYVIYRVDRSDGWTHVVIFDKGMELEHALSDECEDFIVTPDMVNSSFRKSCELIGEKNVVKLPEKMKVLPGLRMLQKQREIFLEEEDI